MKEKRQLLADLLTGKIDRAGLRRPIAPIGELNDDGTVRVQTLTGPQNCTMAELARFSLDYTFIIDDIKPADNG